jgi:hypothetical protein
MRWLCATIALHAILTATVASAESAVVIVPDAAIDADDLARARGAAIEVLAEHGIRLVRPPDGEPCDQSECAARIAQTSGADFTLLLVVEAADDGSSRVRAQIVPAAGEPRDAVAIVGERGWDGAAAEAVDRALQVDRGASMGFLMVRTRPPGALVEIDGEPIGPSPLRRTVAPGEHRVRVVSPNGGRTRERIATVREGEETALEIDLSRASEDEPGPSGPTRSEPSPINWLLGGGLAIAGVVLLISPLQTLATEGQCVDMIEDVGCVERVQFGAQSGVLFGFGLAALIAAVVVDVVAPIRVDVAVGEESGMMHVSGRF